MTLAELEKALGDRRIARHQGQVFFTTYDAGEADEWRKRGAMVHSTGPVHEVHLARALDPMDEIDDDGEPVDTRLPLPLLLGYLRDRDGFERPWRESWA